MSIEIDLTRESIIYVLTEINAIGISAGKNGVSFVDGGKINQNWINYTD